MTDQRAVEAVSADRGAWAPHRRRHVERQEREREARRVSADYRQGLREAELTAQPHKVCTGCKQSLPLSAYSPKGPGRFNARCRPCHSARQAAHKRAKQAAWTEEERERHRAADRAGWYARQGRAGETGRSLEERAADRQRREASRAAARAARLVEAQQRRQAERAESSAARAAAKAARASEALAQRALAHAETVARRQAEAEAQGPDSAEVDVDLAIACAAALEAREKAQVMAAIAAARATAVRRRQAPYARPSLAQRLAHLWPSERPRTVALRDGSSIPIGELARRHFWREQGTRFTRYSRNWS